jgi:DNA-directed RNA polymerase specialized sigma subunit
MDRREKVALLSTYKVLGAEVDRLAQEVCRWEDRRKALETVHFLEQSETKNEREIFRLQKELRRKIREILYLRRKIDRAISGLPDGTQRLLCSLRYLDGLTWEEIAEKMFYSVQHLHKIHVKALERIELDKDSIR